MKRFLYLLIIFMLVSCNKSITPADTSSKLADLLIKSEWIDLTYSFDENSIYWPTNVSYTHDTVSYGMTNKGYFYSSFKFSAEEHGGTHFDAPIHFSINKKNIDNVPLTQLIGAGVIIDVSEKASKNPDYLISTDDFLGWEKKHGHLPDGAIILLYTGHGKYYYDREKYLGTSLTGAEAVPHLHFPGLSPEAAIWLVESRKVNGIGLDTPSIDYGQSNEFMTHRILCDHGLTMYENLTNLDKLPEKGSFIIALPMKIKGGSGSPLRIVAII